MFSFLVPDKNFISHRYRGEQGREREQHDGHDEVDQVADGEDHQESVELPLELLAAEHKDGKKVSRDTQDCDKSLREYYKDIRYINVRNSLTRSNPSTSHLKLSSVVILSRC